MKAFVYRQKAFVMNGGGVVERLREQQWTVEPLPDGTLPLRSASLFYPSALIEYRCKLFSSFASFFDTRAEKLTVACINKFEGFNDELVIPIRRN